jgi:hypothetical protein
MFYAAVRRRGKQKCKNILCLDLNFHLSVQAGVEGKTD